MMLSDLKLDLHTDSTLLGIGLASCEGVREGAGGLEMAHLINSKKLEVVGIQGSYRIRQEMRPERMAVPSIWQPFRLFSGA